MLFHEKLPDTRYVGNWQWIPKKLIPEEQIVKDLTFAPENQKDEVAIRIFRESKLHYLCPKYYDVRTELKTIDMTPQFPDFYFDDRITSFLDDAQEATWKIFENASHGILHVSCGRGKTVLACKKIAHEHKQTLIVVPTTGLLSQWEAEIRDKLGYQKEIGRIQANRFDWDKPIVIATIHTLALHAYEWPEAFKRRYGIVIYDEVHETAPRIFQRASSLFWGRRFGLTATKDRDDGLQGVYLNHIGQVFLSDTTQPVKPLIFFKLLPTMVNLSMRYLKDMTGQLSIARLWTYLGKMDERNIVIRNETLQALKENRKILILSYSKPHLSILKHMLEECGVKKIELLTGDTPQGNRTGILRNSDVTLGTMGVAKRGLDAPMLDTVFFVSPFKSSIAMVQGIGRTLRYCEGKNKPVIVIFEDYKVRPAKGLCDSLKVKLNIMEWKFQIIG